MGVPHRGHKRPKYLQTIKNCQHNRHDALGSMEHYKALRVHNEVEILVTIEGMT